MTAKNNIPAGYKDSAVGIIPQEWEVKYLGDLLARLANGLTYDVSVISGHPVSRIETISSGEINYSKVGYIDNVTGCESYKMQKGDILYSHINSLAHVGKVAYYDGMQDLYHGMNLLLLRANEKIDSNYLYAYLLTSQAKHIAQVIAKPAVNQASISISDIRKIKLAVPPMEVQRKIAEILGVWDEAIEKQSRLVERLELRKRALMQRLLSGRTRLPGFTTPWQKVSYTEILKEVKRNMVWDDNEEYDLISVKRRSGGLFHRERLLGKDIKTKNLRPALCGDFLISKMQIVHGASGLVTAEFDGMKISGSYIALVAKNREKVDMNFINWYSKTPYFYHQTYVSSYGVHIEKMTFDLDSFMSMTICIPSLPEQKAIAEVLTTADDKIVTHRKKLDALRQQKRGLMQQLLTGKTRVKI